MSAEIKAVVVTDFNDLRQIHESINSTLHNIISQKKTIEPNRWDYPERVNAFVPDGPAYLRFSFLWDNEPRNLDVGFICDENLTPTIGENSMGIMLTIGNWGHGEEIIKILTEKMAKFGEVYMVQD